MQQAHSLLERMRLTNVPSEPYIEAATVDAVYKVTSSLHVIGIVTFDAAVVGGKAALQHCCQSACNGHVLLPMYAAALAASKRSHTL